MQSAAFWVLLWATWSCKPLCTSCCHNLKWAWSEGALPSRWDPGPLKWEEKMPSQEHFSACCCSACFLPEQDFGLTLRRHNLTRSQKLRQCYSPATPRDHLTIKTVQLAQSPPWKINLWTTGLMGLVVGDSMATQGWSAALPALQSCCRPRDEKLKMKVPKGSTWDEEPPWKGSPTHREISSVFWGTRAAGADGDNADGLSKVCFKTPSSWSWQTSSPPK